MKNRTVVAPSGAAGWAAKPVQTAAVNGSRTVVAPSASTEARCEAFSHVIAGLTQLLRAFDYASDAGRDVWEFAIEISELRAAGMSTTDFRGLVSKGFAQHGQETSLYGAPQRCFRRGEGLTFLPTSALVLTSPGAAQIRQWLAAAVPADDLHAAACPMLVAEPGRSQLAEDTAARFLDSGQTAVARLHCLPLELKPAWEARRRELRVGELLVKKFRVPAGNQELVLSAFEEEGWPAYIDDPLPMNWEIAPKRRLHNVITRLNGSQLVPLVRFHGEGNGEGIGWELLPPHFSRDDNGARHDSAVAVSG